MEGSQAFSEAGEEDQNNPDIRYCDLDLDSESTIGEKNDFDLRKTRQIAIQNQRNPNSTQSTDEKRVLLVYNTAAVVAHPTRYMTMT